MGGWTVAVRDGRTGQERGGDGATATAANVIPIYSFILGFSPSSLRSSFFPRIGKKRRKD